MDGVYSAMRPLADSLANQRMFAISLYMICTAIWSLMMCFALENAGVTLSWTFLSVLHTKMATRAQPFSIRDHVKTTICGLFILTGSTSLHHAQLENIARSTTDEETGSLAYQGAAVCFVLEFCTCVTLVVWHDQEMHTPLRRKAYMLSLWLHAYTRIVVEGYVNYHRRHDEHATFVNCWTASSILIMGTVIT
eukprot:3814057-Rhodomonas_salina.1